MPEIPGSSGYIQNKDVSLYYEVHQSTQDEAPILVLLHGNSEDMHIFDGHIEPLLPYYTVITMDTRHQGRSSQGERPLSYELFAEDLFVLINKLLIGNCIIMGFSDGAITALELALKHPERISAMVLVGPNISPEGLTPAVRKSLQLYAASKSIKRVFTKGADNDKALIRLMLEHPHIDPHKLEKITTPILIITGENDIITKEHIQLMVTSLPKARWEQISGATHFVMKDAPQTFDRIVLDFLMEDD